MGSDKKHVLRWTVFWWICLSANVWANVQVTSIDFKGTDDPSEITIQSSGPVTFEKQDNAQDKQVIFELQGATISKSNARKIDTSSFNSKVSLISPYQVTDKPNTVRVVVQLREAVAVDVAQEGNTIKIKVPVGGGNAPVAAEGSTPPPAAAPAADPSAAQPSSDSASSGEKSNLDTFETSKSTQKFTGKPITLQVRDAEVTDVLRLIGEASGFNTIIGDDVKGKITLSLIDVPWDQALDVILHTLHLGGERKDSILRVVTLKSLLDEKTEELRAKEAAEANIPRITKVFPISYAKLADLQSILIKFASPGAIGGTAGGNSSSSTSSTGSTSTSPSLGMTSNPMPSSSVSNSSTPSNSRVAIVQADTRTNSLLIRDVPDNIEKMKKLIEILDTQTPQVMIEAKVVEATEGFSKNLSGSFGIGGSGSSSFVASFAGGNPLDPLIGTPGVFANGAGVGSVSNPSSGTPNGTFGISPSLSFLPGVSQLNAVLSLGESENKVKIVASPKMVVLNKEKADIIEGTPVLLPGTTTVAGVGTVQTATVQQANVSLSVKPTVTNDGSVLLDLNVSKDVPMALPGGQQGIGNRNLNTLVLVESGTTLVIGGIYTSQISYTGGGFPFLRKLPLIGALFGSDSDSTSRSELLIFVTPRILNIKEAGLSS